MCWVIIVHLCIKLQTMFEVTVCRHVVQRGRDLMESLGMCVFDTGCLCLCMNESVVL